MKILITTDWHDPAINETDIGIKPFGQPKAAYGLSHSVLIATTILKSVAVNQTKYTGVM